MISLLLVLALALAPTSPRLLTENFSIDLAGTPDTRPGTWGNAASVQQPITFTQVPPGYHVRILAVHGEFIAWPKTGTLPVGTSAEAGWGLMTSSTPDVPATYGYPQSPVWVQCGLTANVDSCVRMYDREWPQGFDLPADNTLISQSFVAINTSAKVIHMEPTFTLTYEYIPN